MKTKNAKIMEKLLNSSDYVFPSYSYGDLIEGTVVSVNKKELLLDIGGKSEAIIYGRELVDEVKTHTTLSPGDKVLTFVVQPESRDGCPLLSLRRAYKFRRWQELEKLFDSDSVITAKVAGENKGGLIVDVGIEGFVPFSHLDKVHFSQNTKFANGSAPQYSDVAANLMDKSLQVKIIEMDRSNNRLVLSEREAFSAEEVAQRKSFMSTLKVGEVREGSVTGVMNFGLFVDLGGVEGLVHISEISWEKVDTPADFYQSGDKVNVRVLSVSPELSKVALSIRQTTDDPWKDVGKSYKTGDVVTGEVVKVAPFGAFVRLKPGLDGLVHVSETTGPLKIGEDIQAVIINVEPHSRRMGLSIKKLEAQK